jgi:hypothetical protein
MPFMKPPRSPVIGLCICALLALSASQVHAKRPRHPGNSPPSTTSPLHVAAVPQPRAPTNAELAAFAGPNPTGLQSAFPAGLPTPGAGFPEGIPPPPRQKRGHGQGSDRWPSDATAPVLAAAAAGRYGGAAAGYGGIAVGAPDSPQLAAGTGRGGAYSVVDVARSFIQADGNRDGELTRAEAQRLAIMPYSFEEMDRNHDGIVTRWEYEDAVR